MIRARITGIGKYVPENTVTNFDLEKIMDTSDAWIRERTGIAERHWITDAAAETTSALGAEAAKKALEMAGLQPSDIDFIIFATLSPEHFFPGGGVFLQERLGMEGVGALDIRNQCTGFIYGLSIADQFIRSGMYKNILLVGAEVHSTGLDKSTRGRDVAVLFGDGAGAAVISATEDNKRCILSTHLHADGKHARHLWLQNPGSAESPFVNQKMIDEGTIFPYMNGRYVFKYAVSRFPEVIVEALQATGYSKDDVKLVIPHQANMRITEAVQQKLELTSEKVYSNIHKYGNTTAASIPIAITDALQEGRFAENDLLVLAAFGSGFTWASAILRW